MTAWEEWGGRAAQAIVGQVGRGGQVRRVGVRAARAEMWDKWGR